MAGDGAVRGAAGHPRLRRAAHAAAAAGTRTPRQHVDIGAEVARLTPAFQTLERLLPEALPGIARDSYQEIYAQQQTAGIAAAARQSSGRPDGLARHARPGCDRRVAAPTIGCGRTAVFPDRRRTGHRLARRSDPPAAHHEHLAGRGAGAPVYGLSWTASAIWRRARCASGPAMGAARERWIERLGAPGQQWLLTLRELRVSAAPDLAALMAGRRGLAQPRAVSGPTVPGKLLLVRHGQSIWNLENLFTGWTDVDLSAQGVERGAARRTGNRARRRAAGCGVHLGAQARDPHRMADTRGARPALAPVERDWRLNERHYGALQGLNKARDRRPVRGRPGQDLAPQLRHAASAADRGRSAPSRATIGATRRWIRRELPATESLKDTLARVLPCWEQCIAPQLARPPQRHDRRPRQQPARAGQDARRVVGERHRRAEHPDR